MTADLPERIEAAIAEAEQRARVVRATEEELHDTYTDEWHIARQVLRAAEIDRQLLEFAGGNGPAHPMFGPMFRNLAARYGVTL